MYAGLAGTSNLIDTTATSLEENFLVANHDMILPGSRSRALHVGGKGCVLRHDDISIFMSGYLTSTSILQFVDVIHVDLLNRVVLVEDVLVLW